MSSNHSCHHCVKCAVHAYITAIFFCSTSVSPPQQQAISLFSVSIAFEVFIRPIHCIYHALFRIQWIESQTKYISSSPSVAGTRNFLFFRSAQYNRARSIRSKSEVGGDKEIILLFLEAITICFNCPSPSVLSLYFNAMNTVGQLKRILFRTKMTYKIHTSL